MGLWAGSVQSGEEFAGERRIKETCAPKKEAGGGRNAAGRVKKVSISEIQGGIEQLILGGGSHRPTGKSVRGGAKNSPCRASSGKGASKGKKSILQKRKKLKKEDYEALRKKDSHTNE